ncbi:MAG: penicillin acylase family protein, partial [Rhodothermales bacterium]|nr:penicillin acylase family protein [Rhodothermales bacterium]
MSTLLRFGFFLLAGLFALAAGIGLLWFLAYGVAGPAPEQAQVPALSAPATLGWNPEGDVQIRADDEAGALAALGYAHGRRRAWSVVLWRQAALGRLGAWFGEPALKVDRLARQLGFEVRARAAYDALDDEHRALLAAYAGGLDAALREPSGRLVHEFVLLGIDAEPWEPWHTLALERLFAWLATPPPPPDAFARTDPSVAAFYDADDALRQMLHLHGFENSIAWAARDSAGVHFYQRHVYGATVLPFFQEASVFIDEDLV